MKAALAHLWRDESGQLTVFVAGMAMTLVLVAGLLVDGGSVLSARQQAVNDAFEAARAGAESLDPGDLRGSGTVTVDPSAAVAAANAYLSSIGEHGTVTVNGNAVTVTVSFSHPLAILSAVGVSPVPIRGSATATPVEGTPAEGGAGS